MGYEQKNEKKIDSRLRLCSKRLIRSSPDRFSRPAVATGGAVSESVLSDSNGLRRHFRVAERRNVRRAGPEAAVDFVPLRLGPRRGGKTSKSERILSPSETSGFATLVVSP